MAFRECPLCYRVFANQYLEQMLSTRGIIDEPIAEDSRENSETSRLKRRENSPASSMDDLRTELAWEEREEILIQKWIDTCTTRETKHTKKARGVRLSYRILALLSIITPIVFSGVAQLKSECGPSLITTIGFVVTGILTASHTFLNLGELMRSHFEYAAKYATLITEMDSEMCKPRSQRVACDVFLKRYELLLIQYTQYAPDV